jgi:hypothetical protein
MHCPDATINTRANYGVHPSTDGRLPGWSPASALEGLWQPVQRLKQEGDHRPREHTHDHAQTQLSPWQVHGRTVAQDMECGYHPRVLSTRGTRAAMTLEAARPARTRIP